MEFDPNVSFTTLLLVLFLSIVFATDYAFGIKKDAREPRHISAKVPYFGHMIGVITQKYQYFIDISRKHGLGIFTLAMPGGRLYIITDLALIQAVQKLPAQISTWEIEVRFLTRLTNFTTPTTALAVKDAPLDTGFFGSSVRYFQSVLRPGPGLDDANGLLANSLQTSLGKPEIECDVPGGLDLYEWLKHAITTLTTDALYGEDNPYHQPEMERAFWDYSKKTITLLINFLPSVLAPTATKARDLMTRSFDAYFTAGSHQRGSTFVQGRHKLHLGRWGLPLRDSAAFEMSMGIAFLHNTVPGAFWSLYYAFADPAVLAELRSEAEKLLQKDDKADGHQDGEPLYTVDIGRLRQNGRLASHVRETLRWVGYGSSGKILTEDVTLDGRYLLKKGGYVFMPARAVLFDERLWGPTVNEFRSDRFVKDKTSPAAFRVFGGGASACPGQHLVMNEMIGVLVTMVLRYDMDIISETNKDGKAGKVDVDTGMMSQMIAPPLGSVRVKFRARAAWGGRGIRFGTSPAL